MNWRPVFSRDNAPATFLAVAFLVLGGLVLLTLGGCMLPAAIYTEIRYPRGIEFIDAPSGQSHFVASSGLAREWIAFIGEDRKSCLTLQREGKAISARVRALDGRVLQERQFPLLTGSHPAYHDHDFAIAPDLARIAYYDFATKSIDLYDETSGQRTKLFSNAGSSAGGIAFMRFLKNNEMLLVLNADRGLERKAGDVLLIDTDTGSATSLLKEDRAFWSTAEVAVSPSSRLIMITTKLSSDRLRQTIRIFDLATRHQVADICDAGAGFIYISWISFSPASQMIAWIRHSNEGTAIMISPLSGVAPRLVRLYPKGTRCTFLTFLDEQTLVLKTSEADGPTKRLVAVNVLSGEERFFSEKAFWGKILVAGDRPTILCEMGY